MRDKEEKLKLPPLLAMTVSKSPPAKSEYGFNFTPKIKNTHISVIKLAPSFMHRRVPDNIRGQPRSGLIPGYVPAARSGEKKDYKFLHNNAFYSRTDHARSYFTIRPDWVSEKDVRKNNLFS
ncbi:predicted protein [Nematostella vectensis]|uniref:Uncharacterized protein n=1 Tax=Nematostella vectensis TaxID=45351 RepID=A7RSA9_NEMVE|nr:predicted protein [Nematostella vectensis]|eukprot:XP_001637599.1 predicted protein [Nematostella vectensis]